MSATCNLLDTLALLHSIVQICIREPQYPCSSQSMPGWILSSFNP